MSSPPNAESGKTGRPSLVAIPLGFKDDELGTWTSLWTRRGGGGVLDIDLATSGFNPEYLVWLMPPGVPEGLGELLSHGK